MKLNSNDTNKSKVKQQLIWSIVCLKQAGLLLQLRMERLDSILKNFHIIRSGWKK